ESEPATSMPEAPLGVLGDIVEGLVERKVHAAEVADRIPAVSPAPPEDLHQGARLHRPQPGHRRTRVLAEKGVTPGVLTHKDPSAMRVVERLDPALSDIQCHPALRVRHRNTPLLSLTRDPCPLADFALILVGRRPKVAFWPTPADGPRALYR